MMDQDTDNYDEDIPEMILSWSSIPSVSTTSMSATTSHLIDSTIWLAPSHDTSNSMPQLPSTENEENGYHQDPLMQTQPIDTVTENEHLAELRTYRGGNGFMGNFQANVSTVFAPAIGPAFAPAIAPVTATATATATFTASEAMAPDENISYLLQMLHGIWMQNTWLQELWWQELLAITNMLPLNVSNAGTAQRVPNSCPNCDSSFSRPQELRRHMTSRHSMIRNHRCPHDGCDRSFARPDVLRRHLRNVHRRS